MWESLIVGGVITLIVGIVTAIIVGIPALLRRRHDETVSVIATITQGGDLRLIEQIGCAGLLLTVNGRSKRPAKIKGAKVCLKGSGFLRGFQEGFGDNLGYTPLSEEPEEELFVGLVPVSGRNHPNGWVLDRDDVCNFFLPIRVAGLPLFVEAPSENVTVRVVFFDNSEEVVLRGLSVQSSIHDLIDVWGKAEQTLNVTLEIGVTVLSKTLPDMAHLVGTVNSQAVPMWSPKEPSDHPSDQPIDEQSQDAENNAVYSEVFDQARMQKCVDVFGRIHDNSARKGVFDCCVLVDQPLEGKTLDAISTMRFWVGHDDDVTELGFIDLLIVFRMFSDQHNARTEWSRTVDTPQQTFRIATEFPKSEAHAIFSDIARKIGIQRRTP